MAAGTKETTVVENGLVLTAGAGEDTGATQNVNTELGSVWLLKITNGVTPPTIAAYIQVYVSGDGSRWFKHGGQIVGNTDSNGVTEVPVKVSKEHLYTKCHQGGNTGQNVTVNEDLNSLDSVG